MIGQSLGPYDILSKIGEGGMGEVYEARDTRLNRSVAIKVLPPSVASSPDRLARFRREAQVLASLSHPNIAVVHGFEELVDTHALVMELVPGQTLEEQIAARRGKGLPPDEALPIARQIAAALEAAHEQGIVHRDLKPANVKVADDGAVKVLDFGLAKAIQGDRSDQGRQAPGASAHTMTSPNLTGIGVILGTAGYMSPEQARGKPVDRRTDIWSLGAMLFEALAGRPLFRGETITETIAHVITQPPDWKALPASTPAPVRRVLSRCLEKDPKHRYQSAGDLRLDIDEILERTGALHDASDAARPVASRRPAISLVMVALLGLAGTAIAALWPRSTAGPTAPDWSATFLGGPERAYAPRLSPDGRLLAFQAVVDGLSQVAVMNPDRGNWTVLTREREAGFVEHIGWSADGASILFSRRNGQALDVFSVPALGGEPRLVLENAVAPQGVAGGGVAFVRPNAGRRTQLHILDSGTGDIRPLNAVVVSADDVGVPNMPYRVFPDGRTIGFFGVPADAPPPSRPGVHLIDVDTNTPRLVADFGPTVVSAVAVDPRDRSLLVSLVRGDGQQVLRVSSNGNPTPQAVLTLTDRSGLMDVAADGSLYLDQVNRPMQAMRFGPRDTAGQVRATVPLSRAPVSFVLELPDGRLLATDYFAGRSRLLAINASGEGTPFVETSDATSGPATLAGQDRVAFVLGTLPDQSIALASVRDGRVVQRVRVDVPGAIRGLTASPAGDRLFYAVGGAIWSVSSNGGASTRLGEGDAVAYDPRRGDLVVQLFSSDGGAAKLVRVPVTGGAATPIATHGRGGLASPSTLGPHAVRSDGAIAVTVAVNDYWFFRPAVLDPETGALELVALAYDGDFFSLSWNSRGEIVAGGFQLRIGLWRFRPSR